MERIPRKLKKRNKKRTQAPCDNLTRLLNRAKALAVQYDTKTDTTFQKRVDQLKEIMSNLAP